MTFRQLDERDRNLFTLMRAVDYGRLLNFIIRDGHAVATPQSRKVRSRKIGADKINRHASRPDGDFILTEKHEEFLAIIRATADGIINVIQIQAGLPVSLEIEESVTSI
ncbi:MAG: hypothetical protein BWY31_04071 [Lentisphaerae bacterium ADurb.Bin242]|nr:MAG: hypothetical protein BWY31_04071 [Lentisphaerae bacterium ADurb.Bin242]